MKRLASFTKRKLKKCLPFSRKVDFIICGTQKGGTTALDEYLRGHPDICMANIKEVHYFNRERHFSTTPDYSEYHSYFSPRKHHKLMGEATPLYLYWQKAPKRIFEYNPQIKLIVLLRNPIKRAYSHWNMERSRNRESFSFWDAIRDEKARCQEALPFQHRIYSYVDRGFYSEQLRRLWACFPREQALVIKSEDLKTQPGEILDRICDFLRIEKKLSKVEPKIVHSRSYNEPIGKKEKDYLRSIYKMEIAQLEKELNWDCSDWLN